MREHREKEVDELRKSLKKIKGVEKSSQVKRLLDQQQTLLHRSTQEAERRRVQADYRQTEKELVRSGKKPYFLKKSTMPLSLAARADPNALQPTKRPSSSSTSSTRCKRRAASKRRSRSAPSGWPPRITVLCPTRAGRTMPDRRGRACFVSPLYSSMCV